MRRETSILVENDSALTLGSGTDRFHSKSHNPMCTKIIKHELRVLQQMLKH